MNHCQSAYSCISCCGLFNFKLSTESIIHILNERTKHFNKIKKEIGFSHRDRYIKYKKERESIEDKFEKYSMEIYICPFLGIIQNNRLGCMIHPSITKDEKFQDISFYGSSICLSYDCRVKEMDRENFLYLNLIVNVIHVLFKYYKKELSRIFKVSKDKLLNLEYLKHFIYSRFLGDYTFYKFINYYFDLYQILNSRRKLVIFSLLCLYRLKYNHHITSFEIDYNRFEYYDFYENLKKILFIDGNSKKLVIKLNQLLK